jgi:transposase
LAGIVFVLKTGIAWNQLPTGLPTRGRRGRPRRRPRELFADWGYDHDIYRRQLRAYGITRRIARRGAIQGSGLSKQRWVVERGFAWLHAFKRLRTRYEHRGDIPPRPTPVGLCADLLPPAAVVVKRVPSLEESNERAVAAASRAAAFELGWQCEIPRNSGAAVDLHAGLASREWEVARLATFGLSN